MSRSASSGKLSTTPPLEGVGGRPFHRKVLHGEKIGRKLGFPTLNFHVGRFGDSHSQGVYACQLKIQEKKYKGALYFGPKGQGKPVLEIHVIDFKKTLYGERVSFEVGEKIREPKKFKSLEEAKKVIGEDILQISQKKFL